MLFLCYELSACPLILNSNKVYFASSLIARPILKPKPFFKFIKKLAHIGSEYPLTFAAYFWIPIFFSDLNYNWLDMRNLQEHVKKHSVTKSCSDLALFEYIFLSISKILQILGFQPRISKYFLDHRNNFFSQ